MTMSDKDVERNVRSTTEEGIKTPGEHHAHGIGEQHSITFGEKSEASKKSREKLLEKFKRREQQRREFELRREGGPVERTGTSAGERTPDQG